MANAKRKRTLWAVVPLKSLRDSKNRLADVLCAEEREALVTAMGRDVLATLSATPGVDGVMVVSNTTAIADIASEYGASVVPEGERPGLSEAVASTARRLAKDQIGAMMVVHGDIPLAMASDFQTVIANAAPPPSITIVPCWHDDGTNVMICAPPDILPFHYGPGSYRAHQRAARQAGVAVTTVRVPNLELDIDTPEDLARLIEHYEKGETGPATAQFLSGFKPLSRLG